MHWFCGEIALTNARQRWVWNLCLLRYRSVCVSVRCCSKYILRVVQLQNVYSAMTLWCPGFKHWFYIKDRCRGTKRLSQFTKGFSLQPLFRYTDVIEPDGWKQGGQERPTHSVRSDVCTDVIVMPRAGGSLLQMEKCSPGFTEHVHINFCKAEGKIHNQLLFCVGWLRLGSPRAGGREAADVWRCEQWELIRACIETGV